MMCKGRKIDISPQRPALSFPKGREEKQEVRSRIKAVNSPQRLTPAIMNNFYHAIAPQGSVMRTR